MGIDSLVFDKIPWVIFPCTHVRNYFCLIFFLKRKEDFWERRVTRMEQEGRGVGQRCQKGWMLLMEDFSQTHAAR